MEKLKEMPFVDKNPVFRMLAEIGDLRKLTPEERELYDEDIKVMRDLYATQKWEEEQKRMEIEKGIFRYLFWLETQKSRKIPSSHPTI